MAGILKEGPILRRLRDGYLKESPNGGYEPYIVVYRLTKTSPWVVLEFSKSEEAYSEYENRRYAVDTIILAQRLRKSVAERAS